MNEIELEEIKEKVKRSNKYVLYLELSDIKKLIKYIEIQERVIKTRSKEIESLYKKMLYKYKIKEKIKEITSYAYTSAEERDCQDYSIQVLKELLGE